MVQGDEGGDTPVLSEGLPRAAVGALTVQTDKASLIARVSFSGHSRRFQTIRARHVHSVSTAEVPIPYGTDYLVVSPILTSGSADAREIGN